MIKFLALLISAGVSVLAQTGQIAVAVQNNAGAVVPGASIRVAARPFRNTLANYNASQKAGADGRTTFAHVPQGPYEVCAQLPGSSLLDSCSWLNRAPSVFVQAGATVNAPISLKQGTRVAVQVNDSLGLLAKEIFPGQKLRLEVSVKGAHAVPMTIAPAGGPRQFTALVPADTDLRIQVRSNELQVADASGMRIDMKDFSQFIPFRSVPAPAGAQPAVAAASPTLTLQLVGLQ